MAQTTISYRAVQTLGITSAAAASGGILAVSYLAIPSLLLAPSTLLVHQWRRIYERGVATAPPLAAMSSLSFAYLAYQSQASPLSTDDSRAQLYALAALATLCIVPYTLVFMRSVNAKLLAKAGQTSIANLKEDIDEGAVLEGESVKELVDWWAVLNFGRGIFPMVGAVLGLFASLE
ncbi:hypothetical protein MMC24_005547 [Lignoscripta atroalba]|nr:hypothetical protein [Lignoscripta atroalba]